MKDLLNEVNEKITEDEISNVDKVTPELVQKIIKQKLKNDKVDPELDLTTNALKNSPNELMEHLANLLKFCLVHGYISSLLLICAISPIVKDANGKIDDSGNYRGIGIGSLILKIVDNIILIINDEELTLDRNQFGFQEGSSTSMCTWTVIELVNQFKLAGTPVFSCLLDYRKAFDFCNHEKMFRILLKRKVCLIFVRLMIIIYLNQTCYVKWKGTRSYSFSVRNGSVFSPRGGFGCYLDPLFQDLWESGLGC